MSLSLSYKVYNDEEIDAMISVLKSDKLTMGELVSKFEVEFCKKFNFNYGVMVNSGSSANLLALSVLSNLKREKYLKKGDRVLVPAICWSTSVYPIVQCGLTPVFMDSSDETLNIIAEDIEKYDNIKGIILVHILGNCTNMEKVMEIVKKRNLIVLEDTCESLSSKFKNQNLGSFGDMGTFSFYFSHHMTTIEGGMVVCKTEEDYNLLKCLRAHGWSRGIKHDENNDDMDHRFHFINLGYNFRPMETQAIMGLQQLKTIDKKNKNRYFNYKKILSSILNDERNLDIIKITRVTKNCDISPFACPILLTDNYKEYRKEFMNYLQENKIENRPIVAGNFTRQPVIKMIDKNIDPSIFKGADKVHYNGVYLGCPAYEKLNDKEVEDIVNIIYNFPKFKRVIPFFDKPYNIEKSIPYVNEAIKSTWISIGGKYIKKCQQILRGLTKRKYIVLTNCGTAAIHCMVKCLKYRYPECKKIYIPNNTYVACMNMLLHEYDKSNIEIINVDEETLVLNSEIIKDMDKNAALFVIHNVASITNIPKIRKERPDLIIFEDAAEGFLGSYEGEPVGSDGIASSLSFNMNKNFTCGMGGAFCTNDEDLYKYIMCYSRQGDSGEQFQYKLAGHNYRMTNVAAAILLSQLEQCSEIFNERKKMYNMYEKYLKDIPEIKIQKMEPNTTSSFWYLVVRFEGNINYQFIESRLLKYKIETRPMFYPLENFDHVEDIKYDEESSSPDKINNQYFYLPFNNLSENIIKYVCTSLKQIINSFVNEKLSIVNLKDSRYDEEERKDRLYKFFKNENAPEMFTYYNKRKWSVTENHIYTLLVYKNNEAIGYGHIDCEVKGHGSKNGKSFQRKTYWLGVCVYTSHQRQGVGSYIIYNLLNYFNKGNGFLPHINLVVKNDNLSLVPYYKSFGFKQIRKDEDKNVFMRF